MSRFSEHEYNFNGDMTNNGIFNQDNSINITNNYNIRISLEDRSKSGKIYEYTLFCINEFKNAKNVPDGYIRVTCVNVHSDNLFVSDHIHIDFPKNMYDDYSFDYSIMKVRAKAYDYPKGKAVDYALRVTKIISAENRVGWFNGQFGTKALVLKNENEKDIRDCFKHVYSKEISHECLCEILTKQLHYLEGFVSSCNQLKSGFLSNMILTYYFANSYNHELENKSLYYHNLNREVIVDLLQLVSKIIYGVNNGEIFMWRQLLIEVNEICNVMQNINKNITDVDKKTNDFSTSIDNFANKIETAEIRKMIDKIKRRNQDFGYKYPKDVGKYKESLHDYTIWYLVNQRYLTTQNYDEDWMELLNIEEKI